MMKVIESIKNDQVKKWKKLHDLKERKKTGLYLIEGYHLIEEAIKYNVPIEQLMFTAQEDNEDYSSINERILISENVAKEISFTKQPQGIFAVVKMNEPEKFSYTKGHRYILLDQLQDPGNLGTIIRTADAANYDGIVIGENSVDLYNDKVIRSAQGSHWHIPIVICSISEAISEMKKSHITIYAATLNNDSISYESINCSENIGIIIGNEGNGIRPEIIELASHSVHIPMPGKSESLNAAVAAGIIIFSTIK